ncbi:MAG: hypothetical protein D6678_05295 [Zetaproteobacteria bacterium]|nr:MAG: hypothetical protein D6678_05295 [Zetaproteobacteria bacterium]
MKKMLLSAAAFAVVAVSAVAVAPTTSEAIPAFARQTGAACLSCHFMSFPTLASFGRSFKINGFTDVGEQALVEDEGLSIPAQLNITAVVRPQFQSVKSTGAAVSKTAAITADQVLLIGGRFGTNSGVFIEYDGTFANIQIMNSFDFGSFRGGVNIFNTGFGETAGLEVSSVHGQHAGLLNGKNLSAASNIASAGGNTGGVALWAANDWAVASFSLITDGLFLDGATNNGHILAPSGRLFLQPEVAGWDTGIGFGITSGKTGNSATATALGALPGQKLAMKKFFVDAQAQGELGDTQIGVYADWASADASNAAELNLFNPSTAGKLQGWSIRANIKPLHNIIIGGGAGELKTVGASKTSQWQIGAEYEVYQNFVISLIYNNTDVTPVGGVTTTTKTTLLDVEALI